MVGNLVAEIENFNFCLFVCLLFCLYLTFCQFRKRKMVQSWFQKLFLNQGCDAVLNLAVEFSIWNFYIFHYTLICRFADVHGSCRAQKWNINNYRGCCVQRIFSKNRFGGQTIGTVLHMSVGPFGPGIGIYPNIWDVVYKVYYKKKDFEAK